jgi:hypothetical protein
MGKPLGQVKQYADEHKWQDDIDKWVEFPDGKMVLLRIVGPVEILARHWIDTLKGKVFPAWCPKLDSETEEYQDNRYCPAHDDFEDKPQKVIVGNCIIRSKQERGDDNPIEAFMLPHACNQDIQNIMTLIKADPSDPEQGVDLAVLYDKKAQGNKKWSIQRGDRTPLTDKEKGYKLYPISKLMPNFQDPEIAALYAKQMKESMARNKYYVLPTQRVTENTRDPFKCFKGDPNGKPWTEFKVLVDYRNEQTGGKHETTSADDGKEEVIDEQPEQPIDEQPAKTEPAEEQPASAKAQEESKPDPKPDTKPEPTKEKASGFVHPDKAIGTKNHDSHGTVPECFAQYDGTLKCHQCPARLQCIDETADE